MKVAVCSRSFSANPQLRAELLEAWPEARFNDSQRTLAGAELAEFIGDAEGAVIGLETVDEALLARTPALRVVAKYGVGLDRVDLEALSARGIGVGWSGGVNAQAVAEVVLARTIDLLRGLSESDAAVRRGGFPARVGREISEITLGIYGCGAVGKAVARVFRALGARVLAHDLRDFPEFYAASGVIPVDLPTLLAGSDVLTVHVPLTPRTQAALGGSALDALPRGALLSNTARGGSVDERALAQRLSSGQLGGAAFDVFDPEPPVDLELLGAPNLLLSAHLGGSSRRAHLAMGRAAIMGLGQPRDAGVRRGELGV